MVMTHPVRPDGEKENRPLPAEKTDSFRFGYLSCFNAKREKVAFEKIKKKGFLLRLSHLFKGYLAREKKARKK